MATKYVTVQEVNTLLGTSGEDSLIEALIQGAESLFDGLIGSETGLISSAKTEDFSVNDESLPPEKRNRVFYLRTYKPTAITTINGISPGTLDTDYTLTRNTLEFKDAVDEPTAFPYRFRIVYTSGFADINAVPADIKNAIKYIVSGFYSTKNSQGLSSFKQDLLSVNYKDGSVLDTILDTTQKTFVHATVSRYTVYSVIS